MDNGFKKAIDFLMSSEIVYAKGHYGDMNHVVSELEPGDDGGLTKYGIDQRSHPTVNIDQLTYDQAVEIYKEDYWNKSHAEELPYPLSLVQVDGSVNCGVGQQTKFLQRVCGVTDDGAFGPKTLAAAIHECQSRGVKAICREVIVHRDKFYRNLAKNNLQKTRFLDGWLNRLDRLKKEVDLA